MEKAAFKLALALSLLIHAGVASGYLLLRHEPRPASVVTGQDAVLVVEVVSESDLPPVIHPSPPPAVNEPTKPAPIPMAAVAETPEVSQPELTLATPVKPIVPLVTEIASVMEPLAQAIEPKSTAAAAHADASLCHPLYALNAKPAYPVEARRLRQEGLVVLLAKVSQEGVPVVVTIEASSGHSVLDEAARKAVEQWKFTPASQDGRPMAAELEIPVRFKLLDK